MTTAALLKLLGPILGAGTVAVIAAVVVLMNKAKKAAPPVAPGAPAPAAKEKTAAAHEESSGNLLDLRRSFASAMSALKEWAPRPADRLAAPWVLSIGRAGAGKSALLDSLPLERMGQWTAGHAPVGEPPCRFHFYERGVVLDLSGSLMGSDRAGFGATWKGLITLLQRHRPERPADAIVISVPITDFVGPARLSAEEHERAGARLQACLQQLYLGLGLQLPVYVVVTQCDQIPGFSALCRTLSPERRREVLGWSSPYALEAAFTPEWIDEAIALVSRSVQDAEFAAWSSDYAPADGEDLAAFPSWLSAMTAPMRQQLGRAFRMTAYEASYPLRGIYFTGDGERSPAITETAARATGAVTLASINDALASSDTAPEPKAEERGVKPAFVADLFNDKIFAEHGLARVARRTTISKNRAVATMQVMTAAIVIGGPFGLWEAAHGLSIGSYELTIGVGNEAAKIDTLLKDVEKAGRDMLDPAIDDYIEIGPMLNSMASVESGALRSVFLPASIASPLHGRIRDAVQTAFGGVMFPEFAEHLKERRDSLFSETPRKPGVREPLSLPQYLAELQLLGAGVDMYNRLGTAGQGSTRELASLIEYLYPQERISPAFFQNDHYYRDALVRTHAPEIAVTAAYQSLATRRAVKLIDQSYTTLVSRLGRSAPADSEADGGMESLRADVAAVVALRAFLDTAGPVEQALNGIKKPFVFGNDYGAQIHGALARYRARLTGQLTTQRAAGAQSPAATLRTLDALLQQPFMQAPTGREIPSEIESDATLRWNLQRLDQAIQLHTEYEKFVAHGLDSLADGVRLNVRRLAAAQAASAMANLVAEAAIVAPAPAIARSESVRDLKGRVTAFDQSIERLSQISDLFDTMGATPLVDALDAVTTTHASRLLARIDAFADLPKRYALPAATVGLWNGQAPFSAALGSRESGLTEFLGGEEQTLRTSANLARSLVTYLEDRGGDAAAARSVRSWRDVIDAIDRADQKPPAGPLAMLDRTVIADVDSIDTRSCVRRPVRSLGGNDLVTRRLNELRQTVWRRCVDVATGAARTSYAQLEETFRTRLAGRFPFSQSANAPDALPADIVAFFRQYEALSPDAVTASGAAAPRVSAFLAELDAARRFFAPLLDSANRPPVYDYQFDFRVNRAQEVGANQIAEWSADVAGEHLTIDAPDANRRGRWRAGDSVQVTLRWATGSNFVPLDGNGAAVLFGGIRAGAGGRWGLLRLIRSYASEVSDGEPGHLIMLSARTARRQQPANPSGDARMFIRVRLFHPDTKAELQLPTFPIAAPGVSAEARR